MDEPFVDLKIHEQIAWSYIGLVAYCSYSATLATFVIYHGRKVYQDLFTTERASVQHRRAPPSKTDFYKLSLALCWLSVFFYWIADTSMVFTYFMKTDEGCIAQQKVAGITYHTAKTLMYLLFLARLFMVYRTSAYAYSSKCVSVMCAIIIVYGLIVMLAMALVFDSRVYAFGGIHNIPNYCDGALEGLTGALVALEDMAVSVGFLAAFYIPLRRTIKAVAQSVRNVHQPEQKALFKIKYAGTKHTIITAVAMISTFILVTSTVATDLNFIIGLDPVVNSVCMILMTPYYRDEQFYQRLCKCCLWCVSRKQAKYEHARSAAKTKNDVKYEVTEDPTDDPLDTEETEWSADTGNTTRTSVKSGTETAVTLATLTSVDTMDQIQKTAADVNPSNLPPTTPVAIDTDQDYQRQDSADEQP